MADKHWTPALNHQVGQKVWLYTHDINLRDIPRKLAPRFIGPYPIAAMINTSAVRLSSLQHEDPSYVYVHQIKPVMESELPSIQDSSTSPESLTTILQTQFDTSWMLQQPTGPVQRTGSQGVGVEQRPVPTWHGTADVVTFTETLKHLKRLSVADSHFNQANGLARCWTCKNPPLARFSWGSLPNQTDRYCWTELWSFLLEIWRCAAENAVNGGWCSAKLATVLAPG